MSSSDGLRQRKPTAKADSTPVDLKAVDAAGVGIVDILRVLGGLLLLSSLLSYFVTKDSLFWGYRPSFTRPSVISRYLRGPILLTDAELLEFNASDPTKPIYLALNGTIYDVTANPRMYGIGASYNKLTGKDATRAYITGCFDEDGIPDIRGAEWTYVPADVPGFDEPATAAQKVYREQELRKARKSAHATISHWAKMFSGETGKDYFEVGKVKRPEGWLERLPVPKLCEAAQNGRPQPQQEAQDPGAKYRGAGRP